MQQKKRSAKPNRSNWGAKGRRAPARQPKQIHPTRRSQSHRRARGLAWAVFDPSGGLAFARAELAKRPAARPVGAAPLRWGASSRATTKAATTHAPLPIAQPSMWPGVGGVYSQRRPRLCARGARYAPRDQIPPSPRAASGRTTSHVAWRGRYLRPPRKVAGSGARGGVFAEH